MSDSRKVAAQRHYRVLFEFGSLSGLSDAELLVRFLNRDDNGAELAFAALVERHSRMVMRICRAILRNEHDAEDAFQATFLILATKAGRLRVRDSLGPWLSAVAGRIGRGARATALARTARELRAARLTRTEAALIEDGDGIAAVLREEIDRLPERYRLPLLLCDLELQSHQEAARNLGWPLGTLKSRQARARIRLRARLSRRGLSSLLPASWTLSSARVLIPDTLIQSTSRAAIRLVSRGTAAQAVSASVKALVTRSLRSMIMTRLSIWAGVLLTISAVVAATVAAQTAPNRAKRPDGSVPASADEPVTAETPMPPVFECEVKIWKDGAPVTTSVKLMTIPGELTQFPTAAGTVEVRFHPRKQLLRKVGGSTQPKSSDGRTPERTGAEALARAARELLLRDQLAVKRSQDTMRAEELARIAASLQPNQEAVIQFLRTVGADKPHAVPKGAERNSSANDDHETRLAEIERKLERILSVLEPAHAKTREGTTQAAPR